MWQTSDKVSADTITAVTDKCDREDCRLSARVQTTTLVAASSHYDKTGRLCVNDDANSRITQVDCGACWKSWEVHHDHGVVDGYRENTMEQRAKMRPNLYADTTIVHCPYIPLRQYADETYLVVRTDDHGNPVVVQAGLDREAADKLCAEMTERGHKQTYEVKPERLDAPTE